MLVTCPWGHPVGAAARCVHLSHAVVSASAPLLRRSLQSHAFIPLGTQCIFTEHLLCARQKSSSHGRWKPHTQYSKFYHVTDDQNVLRGRGRRG